jgi:hypothetical protein
MQRAIVVFEIPRRHNDRIRYARSVAAAMTGNPHFPSPTPAIAVFEAHIAAAADAQIHALIGPIGSAAERDARLAAVPEATSSSSAAASRLCPALGGRVPRNG